MTYRLWALTALSLVVGMIACGGSTPKPSGPTDATTTPPEAASVQPLRLHGSNTIGAELAPSLVEAFFRANGVATQRKVGASRDTSVVEGKAGNRPLRGEVVAVGTTAGFQALLEGKTDIVLASRRILAEEREDLLAKGVGELAAKGTEHVIGLDAIALIVHTGNPVHELEITQIKDIFSGKAKDWNDVGGLPGEIKIFTQHEESGTYDLLRRLVLGGDEIASPNKRSIRSGDLAAHVASDKNAIGFVGFTRTGLTRALGIQPSRDKEPVHPTAFAIASEDYPLSRRLYLYTRPQQENPMVKEFVAFALSDEGQKVVREAGFVDLSVSMSKEAPWCRETCPKEYKEVAEKEKRLSATFRFERRSSDLDPRALRDLKRVGAFLKAGNIETIHLMGFSDNVPFADNEGEKGANDRISIARAEAVKTALADVGIYKVQTRGFGEAIPVATNDTPEGRDRNRRVEVWVEFP